MKTKVVHVLKAPYDIYIGRANPRYNLPESIWHNPFHIGKDGTREECIVKYFYHVVTNPYLMSQLHTLKGKTLACWCDPLSCHGHVLAYLADHY